MATALRHLCGAAAVGPSDTSAESSSALMFDPDTTQTTFRPSTSATFAAISAATAAAPDASTTCAARMDSSRAQQCGRGYQRSMPGEHAGGAGPAYQTKGKKRAHCSTQLIVAHEDDAVRKRAHMLVAQLHRRAHTRRAAKQTHNWSAQREACSRVRGLVGVI